MAIIDFIMNKKELDSKGYISLTDIKDNSVSLTENNIEQIHQKLKEKRQQQIKNEAMFWIEF